MEASIWKNKRFVAYSIGLMINSLGNAVYMVALPLLVYSMSGSALDMTIMAILETLPKAILGLLVIGSIVDRFSRRTIMFAALGFQAVLSLLIAILYQSHSLEIWMLFLLGTLISIGHEFTRAVEFAILPVMFKENRLGANAGLSSAHTLMLIAGPALAALLLGVFSYPVLLWINAISYLGPILLCIWTKLPYENLGGIRSTKEIWDNLRAGFVFIGKNPLIRSILGAVSLRSLATSGITIPVLFALKNTYGLTDQAISWILAINAVGMFISSVFIPYFQRLGYGKLLYVGQMISTAGIAMLIIPAYWIIPVGMFISSIGFRAFYLAYEVMLQEATPDDMRGRVGSTTRTISFLTSSLSTALLGALMTWVGTQFTFAFAAALTVLPILLMAKTRLHKAVGQAPAAQSPSA